MNLITVSIMDTKEAFDIFQTDKMKKEYKEELSNTDIQDIGSIQEFLDHANDIQRLTEDQCELFNIDYEEGYYISTWNNEYLGK
ncbi:MAG TPA: hypothetical protein GXZ90_01970 [Clostridiales bacterium]|nr:hypothetical protein [Clostridiales bacterium]